MLIKNSERDQGLKFRWNLKSQLEFLAQTSLNISQYETSEQKNSWEEMCVAGTAMRRIFEDLYQG